MLCRQYLHTHTHTHTYVYLVTSDKMDIFLTNLLATYLKYYKCIRCPSLSVRIPERYETRLRNHVRLVVTVDFRSVRRSFQGGRNCDAPNFFEYV